MKEIAATEFKATCLAVLAQVQKSRKSVRVTRYGKAVAEIVPPSPLRPAKKKDWMGSMAGRGEVLGDIVGPSTDPSEWNVLR